MKITFPHLGNAWIVIQALFEALDIEVVVPPLNSQRALELGSKIAPESACLPLKINLGNYLEAAAQGADTILITGGSGPCRFGLYGEVERQILQEAGYPYEVVVLELPDGSWRGLRQRIRYIAGERNSWTRILRAMRFAFAKSVAIDEVEDLMHRARPRLGNPGETEKIYLEAQRRLAAAMSVAAVRETVAWTWDTIRERIAGKERREEERAGLIRKAPLRIGVIGEIYTILDPFSSLDMEKSLGYMGVEVDRSLYLSGWVGKHILQGWRQGYRPLKQYEKLARPYLPHFVGGHGQETVGAAVEFARRRVDGVIHLLPLNCMPEIVAAAILPQIQRDYGIPMMTLTVDEHTGRAGFQTRLEAFADLAQLAREDRTAVLNRREEAMCVAGK